MEWWIWCLAGYGLGSIPVGVIVARAKGIDIMKVGSGNIGATNVLRVLGPKWGITVFGLDVLKGALPVVLSRQYVSQPVGPVDTQMLWMLAGLAAIAGHCLSPFLRFKGGKGIATALGMALGASPVVALSAFGCFFILLGITRYVSLASMVGVAMAAVFGSFFPNESRQMLLVYVPLTIFIVLRHRENIQRLRTGTERKFVLKKTEDVPTKES